MQCVILVVNRKCEFRLHSDSRRQRSNHLAQCLPRLSTCLTVSDATEEMRDDII